MQLGLLVFGLVILLSFQSDIAEGAAGCFSNIASVDDDAAAPATAPTPAPPAASLPDEIPSGSTGTPVEVRVIRTQPVSPDAGASSPDAVEPSPTTGPAHDAAASSDAVESAPAAAAPR